MRKLAVVLPGAGYHADKPLLYYSKKILLAAGFEICPVEYGALPGDMRDCEKSLERGMELAFECAAKRLCSLDFSLYEKIFFVSKSIGTAVALRFASEKNISSCHILFTPLAKTFDFALPSGSSALAFHGSSDPWCGTDALKGLCAKCGVPLTVLPGANHSLETGNVLWDVKNLCAVMGGVQDFVKEFGGEA